MSAKKAILTLRVISLAVIISGILLSIYGYMSNIGFVIINTRVPGLLFGIVTIFLGIRYMRSLSGLKMRIEGPEARFSWDNFKRPVKSTKSIKT